MNLLITRHDKIGDYVLTLPMIKIAKQQLVDTKIIVLVSKVNYEFSKKLDFIDDVILYEDSVFTLAKKIKEKKIDVSISAFTDTKLAIALMLAGVKTRIAPATKIAQIFSNKRVTQRRSQVKKREFEYNLDLLKYFKPDISLDFKRPLLNFSSKEKLEILNIFKQQFQINEDFKYIVFHAGFGGSSDGNLTLDDYINLAKAISNKKGLKIVFTFGPDDYKSLEYIKEKIDFDAILYESKLSLIDFCKLLSNFEIFISTSTGPMHLAGAVNIKTISFFGDSLFASAKRWGTISEEINQNNYCIPNNYTKELYYKIEKRLEKLVDEIL
ncbi:heptosyltransferase [Malaciobacter mytili LMG 24559]|uniref:Heptosyltransferase n=1 Tax=Malaciobacter mytili LMG 24559 TaxID=1032238 RepID=A0AAX2AC45_9BACT|nr:glycosyltransferase family 9 protein [Malaciobacter mytili]AXH15526.1 heptosyltransferase [Malaciobacter mytili LMG 24559]RXK12015.1 heptosyltransferase [Malaciobacter mytili LMG 24559]